MYGVGNDHRESGAMTKPRRGRGPVALAATLSRITDAALRKRGFAQSTVITNWAEIVGAELADHTTPQRLAFPRSGRGGRGGGTLHVRVAGALATELQHLEPLVLERINTYFGYQAVARLALEQGPLPPRRKGARRTPTPALDAEEEGVIESAVSGVEDESLRRALAGLGRAVMASDKGLKTGGGG